MANRPKLQKQLKEEHVQCRHIYVDNQMLEVLIGPDPKIEDVGCTYLVVLDSMYMKLCMVNSAIS